MQRGIVPLVASLSMACVSTASEPARTTLTVKGLSCDGCTAAVERRLGMTEGVTAYMVSADHNLAQSLARTFTARSMESSSASTLRL